MARLKQPRVTGASFRRLRHSVKPAVQTPDIARTTRVPNEVLVWWEAKRLRLPVATARLVMGALETIIERDLANGVRDRRAIPTRWAAKTADGRVVE